MYINSVVFELFEYYNPYAYYSNMPQKKKKKIGGAIAGALIGGGAVGGALLSQSHLGKAAINGAKAYYHKNKAISEFKNNNYTTAALHGIEAYKSGKAAAQHTNQSPIASNIAHNFINKKFQDSPAKSFLAKAALNHFGKN